MIQVARWKVTLVALAAVLGILFSLPNLFPQKTLDTLPKWVPAKQLKLGLDLRGGSYLEISVDVAQLKKDRLTNLAEDIGANLQTALVSGGAPTVSGDTITVTTNDPGQLEAAFKVVSDAVRPTAGQTRGPDLTVTRRGNNQVVATYRPEALAAEASDAVARSIEIIRRRVDPDGTREISITREGVDRIVLQAPGDTNAEKMRDEIGQPAHLTFQIVDETVTPQDIASGILPPGTILLPQEEDPSRPIAVRRRVVVGGEMMTNAQLGYSDKGQPVVDFRFNSVGAHLFGQITSQNIGKRFAVVLDNKVISAPNILSAITGGSGYIEGNFTADSASDLANKIKAGALPAKLTIEDERTTTAELGQDAVRAGEISTVIGFAAIVVFMLLSYGFLFGGISVIGLLLNLVMMVAILSVNQAALTLPGIAGLILTLAVAVDANVLIYERIRDEERAGQTPLMAMETGFKRASVSILDANVTTLISGVIMFMVAGSGPVKGFAWTLSVGVVTSVFTAMLVSQVLLGWWFRAAKPKQLPI